ncbi:MAG TPA: poly-beta-1,6-N-acetyl-D-glucosamine synthase [Candidatus Competibacteraceae bacterium]|nr:poly-beta-1,6-N-acetyl-D-glucosamine synthase [Candidatus Competibacteraceae bacterium]HQD56666.1 poly-beta-1,6-N-acetyl-D-glucosamine synthase [Candidatus Competibacteraceae bacterium]
MNPISPHFVVFNDNFFDLFEYIQAILAVFLSGISTAFKQLSISQILLGYVFYYPFFMSYVWMIGALYYYFHYEKHDLKIKEQPELKDYPSVSILVPCYNEEDNVKEVITHLMGMNYPNYEVIAINDGSKDRTGDILNHLSITYPKLKVIHHAKNQGKAIGLNTAALFARSEYLIGIDGDALLDHDAIPWLLRHFQMGPRVAAVTGNPRIRTRSTLLGRIQVGEFSSIVGLIKRAQRTYGRLFTVSGVVAMFRRTALHDVNYWSPDMLTEDIDISWKLQLRHWDVRFEPRALCWILMPETLHGLWKQRLRWAMGGVQVMLKNVWILTEWRKRRMWPIFLEYFSSLLWAYLMASVILLWSIGLFIDLPASIKVGSILPHWHGVMLGTTCLLQILISLYLDRQYDHSLFRYYFWMVWYPLAYWMLNMMSTVVSVPKVLLRGHGKRAVWVSPDRGLRTPNEK